MRNAKYKGILFVSVAMAFFLGACGDNESIEKVSDYDAFLNNNEKIEAFVLEEETYGIEQETEYSLDELITAVSGCDGFTGECKRAKYGFLNIGNDDTPEMLMQFTVKDSSNADWYVDVLIVKIDDKPIIRKVTRINTDGLPISYYGTLGVYSGEEAVNELGMMGRDDTYEYTDKNPLIVYLGPDGYRYTYDYENKDNPGMGNATFDMLCDTKAISMEELRTISMEELRTP